MQTLEIKSFQDFIEAIEETRSQLPIFRGHGNVNWDLILKIGRVYQFRPTIDKKNSQEHVYKEEAFAFEDFKRRATP